MPEKVRHRRKLLPMLTDEPVVGMHLVGRVRIVLVAIVVTFALTNLTAYLIGRGVQRAAEHRTDTRITELERQFNQDLQDRAAQREAEDAARDAAIKQLSKDACVLADRAQPRDEAVQEFRKRYGCTGEPPAPFPTARPPAAGDPAEGLPGRTPDPRPTAPPAPPPPPSPPAPPDDPLLCLPLIGCIL